MLGGCVPKNSYTRKYVADRVKAQTAYDLNEKKEAGKFDLPASVVLSDGVTEDEAVAIALYNNAQFQTDLVAIAIANADLIDAGIIPNPLLRYLSPNGGIVAQGYINFYVGAMLQRPRRVAASKREAHRTAENMVQRSFTLIRDVQVAYADLLLAKNRVQILGENAAIRSQMMTLTSSRLRNGDISELEATTVRVDSLSAVDNLLRAAQDTIILRNRFNALLGLNAIDTVLNLTPAANVAFTKIPKEEFLKIAFENQPELKAATAAVEAAGKRVGWERSKILNFTGVLNGQKLKPSGDKNVPDTYDLGLQMDIPIFNQNNGKVARAKADLEQASFQYIALRQRITLDIAEAYVRYELAYRSYDIWNNNVLPSLEEAVKLSQNSFGTGDVSYLPVLEATRLMLDARLRKAEVEAELRRSVSQLNFRIGKKLLMN
jgi:cobalt-zinc-cadmium efflux system outer membrane protein